MSGQYASVTPRYSSAKSTCRAVTWESGRNDTLTSSFVPKPNASIEHAIFDAMFPWVSMAPLGAPVVPEV